MQTQVEVTGDRLVADEFERYPRGAQSVIMRALNRGVTAGRTYMARAIASDVGLKVGYVTKAMRTRNATANDPVASFASGFARIPLMQFGARGPVPSRGRGNGVSFKMGTGNPRSRIGTAFIVTMRSGRTGVFMRNGRARTPIRELYGPSLGFVFGKFRPAAKARAEEMILSTLDHELERLSASA